ncbi:unnamed protein product [Polarella glacialis]|uniref:Cytochrome P450 n=1 Tax=Polarella glacialis TaxID=89957 RepID=A0A813KZD4_POLGL|nr:unnamed protein product [Polarella glacialis]
MAITRSSLGLAKASKSLAAAACGALALAALLAWRRARRARRWPPGSFGWPLIGQTIEYMKDPGAFHISRHAEHGGTFKTSLLFSPTVLISPIEANGKFFFSLKALGWPYWFKLVIGETALPMIEDPMHKRIRTLNGRAFIDAQLDSYLPQLQELTAKHLNLWAAGKRGQGQPCDLYFDIKLYAFDMAQTVILGVDMPVERADRLMRLFTTVTSGLKALIHVEIPGLLWHKVMSCRRQLVGEYQEVINTRREQLRLGSKPTSMLDIMLTADDVNGDVELQDFCIAMVFAGHDTTLATMQSTLYWLSKQPAVLAELRQEVLEAWDGSSQLTRETLGKVPKVRAFIQEVWRMTPPVVIASRRLEEESVIDGYVVPKGWKVNYSAALVGQKAEQPNEFRMGRYLDSSGHFVDQTFEPWNFGAFGGGSRMCVGYKFARDEMLVFMIQLLRHFSFTVASAQAVKFPFNYWRVSGTFSNCL